MRILDANVWVDGVFCPVGSTPPPELAAKIGDHAWRKVPDPAPVSTEPGCLHPNCTLEHPHAGPAVLAPTEPDPTPEQTGPADVVPPVAAPVGPVPEPERDAEPAPSPLPEPKRAGRGASRTAWAAYAASRGVQVADEMNRDDIIAAVDALP